MNGQLFVQLLAYGLVLSGVYVLLSQGLVLVFSIMEIPNFAQAGIFMVGGYTSYLCNKWFHVSALVTLPVAFIVAGLLGATLWFVLFQRQMNRPRADIFVTAFGALVILQTGCEWIFGPEAKGYPLASDRSHEVFGQVPMERVWIVIVAAIVAVALWFLIERTMLGRAMRAVSQNRFAAGALGMNAGAIALTALVVGSGLGGIAGSLLGGVTGVNPATGAAILLQIFAIVVVGGMGSLRGALIASILIGVGQSFLGYYASEYTNLLFFGAMFAVLLVRPQGLFGEGHAGAIQAS
jgi:branched-chain amino acid transport system permease protein